MRGSPLRQLLGVALLVVIVGLLVRSVTRPEEPTATAPAPPSPAGETIRAELQLTSTSRAVVHFRTPVLAQREVVQDTSGPITLPAGTPVDLSLSVQWQDTSRPQALRVLVTWDGEILADHTFWGTGPVEDVLTFTTPQP